MVSRVSRWLVGGRAGEAEALGPVGCRQLLQEEAGKREYTPTADGSYRTSRDFLGHLLFVQPVGYDLAKSHKLFLAGPEQRWPMAAACLQ